MFYFENDDQEGVSASWRRGGGRRIKASCSLRCGSGREEEPEELRFTLEEEEDEEDTRRLRGEPEVTFFKKTLILK